MTMRSQPWLGWNPIAIVYREPAPAPRKPAAKKAQPEPKVIPPKKPKYNGAVMAYCAYRACRAPFFPINPQHLYCTTQCRDRNQKAKK
jgi:hypothetical protein